LLCCFVFFFHEIIIETILKIQLVLFPDFSVVQILILMTLADGVSINLFWTSGAGLKVYLNGRRMQHHVIITLCQSGVFCDDDICQIYQT